MDTFKPSDPMLAAVNERMTNQGRPHNDEGASSLWFYTDTVLYVLGIYNGEIIMHAFTRSNSQWSRVLDHGTVDSTVSFLNSPGHGPYLSQDKIDSSWADMLPHHPAHPVNPLIGRPDKQHPYQAPPTGGVGN